MKTIGKLFILTFVVGGLIFARSGKPDPRAGGKNSQVKSEHYWVKDHSNDNSGDQLDRKRSHKRRRKIRKPVKGLR